MNDILSKIKPVQDSLLPKIFNDSEEKYENISSDLFFERLLQLDSTAVSSALSDFGKQSLELANKLDLSHPEISSNNYMSLLNKSDLINRIEECVKLYSLIADNELNAFKSVFSKIVKNIIPDIKSLTNLFKDSESIRLYKDSKLREECRAIKNCYEVKLNLQDSKLSQFWQSHENIANLGRNENFYKIQLEKANKMSEVYKHLGLDSMCEMSVRSTADFEDLSKNKYFGYQRITISNLAIAVARVHEFILNKGSILIPLSSLKNHDFFNPKSKNIEHNSKAVDLDEELFVAKNSSIFKKPLSFGKSITIGYGYVPYIYPIHNFEIPSEDVKKVLVHLDSAPETNGKPLFDAYQILIPLINLNYSKNFYYDFSNNKNSFFNDHDLRMNLSKLLIKEKLVVPALIGLKDKKCYFICFWM